MVLKHCLQINVNFEGVDGLAEGIILAGGKSSRMEQNKMLLQYKNKPIIYHVVKSMMTHCSKVTIVTGFYNIDYKQYLQEFSNVHIVHNDQHQLGMFSSIKRAIKDVENDIFLIPGDYPLVKKSTYRKILEGCGPVRVPVCQGRKGHPIFISKDLIPSIKIEDLSSNLKVWRDKQSVTYIEVSDRGTLQDIDTIKEYEKLILERNDNFED